jgi:hypothetical protein
VPIVVAAQRANVSAKSVSRWVAEGCVVHLTRSRACRERPEDGLAPTLDERLRAAEPGLVGVFSAAAARGSWQAAAWLLERSQPERWARPSRVRVVEAEARLPVRGAGPLRRG